MKSNAPSVTTSTWEKHQEARIPLERNARSHLAIRKSDRPYGNIVRRNNNIVQRFQMNVTGVYPNDAMLRQIPEGVRIEKVPGDSLINSKNEWNFFQIPRAVIPHGRALPSE